MEKTIIFVPKKKKIIKNYEFFSEYKISIAKPSFYMKNLLYFFLLIGFTSCNTPSDYNDKVYLQQERLTESLKKFLEADQANAEKAYKDLEEQTKKSNEKIQVLELFKDDKMYLSTAKGLFMYAMQALTEEWLPIKDAKIKGENDKIPKETTLKNFNRAVIILEKERMIFAKKYGLTSDFVH